jgi:hypothetical protein
MDPPLCPDILFIEAGPVMILFAPIEETLTLSGKREK